MSRKATAIVPAYNEEATIADVVRTLRASQLLEQVIVVSDGSDDQTQELAQKAGAVALQLPRTRGKGEAMQHGVTHAKTDVIVFFDADLVGLTTGHVERLLVSVFSGEKMMNVGLRDRGKFMGRLMPHLPLIGGERAMHRRVFESVPPRFLRGFMVEAALNYKCRTKRWRYGTVFLPGLNIRHKYDKVALPLALWQYVKMSGQVLRAMFSVRAAHLRGRF